MKNKIIRMFLLFVAITSISACERDLNPSILGNAIWDETSCTTIDNGESQGLSNLDVETLTLGDTATIYYPSNIANSDCLFPIVAWGNGSTGVGGEEYFDLHTHWASYGLVVVVTHTNMTLDNNAILNSVDLLLEFSEDPASPFFDALEIETMAISGKSQGAMAATETEHSPRITTVVAIAGGTPVNEKPTLFLTSTRDFLKPLVKSVYQSSAVTSAMGIVSGEDHMSIVDNWSIREVSASWLRCYLRDNQDACAFVFDSEKGDAWTDYQVK